MYNSNLSRFTFLLSVFLILSCLPLASFAQKGFKVEKVDGVTIVSNPKNPIPKNGLKKRIVFKEELSIVVIEEEENYMFGDQIEFNIDEDGNFCVSDYDNHRIQKYNPKGKYLLTIGRKGQGPGEFEFLNIVQFDKDKNIYVFDGINKRVSFFDKNGKFLQQIAIPARFTYIYKNSKDFIIGRQRKQSNESGVRKSLVTFGLFDEKFKMKEIFQKYEREITFPAKRDEASMSQFFADVFSQGAFRPRLVYALDKDISYVGFTDKYEIDVFSSEGKLIRKIRRDYEPIPVRKKDKTNFIKELQEDQDMTSSIPENIRKKVFGKIKFPKYKSAYQKIAVIENKWLAVIIDFIENEYAHIDLFDKEGRYIAQFKTDVSIRNFFFKNGKAYAVAEEEFPFVKRYAIELQEYKNKKWTKSNIKLY